MLPNATRAANSCRPPAAPPTRGFRRPTLGLRYIGVRTEHAQPRTGGDWGVHTLSRGATRTAQPAVLPGDEEDDTYRLTAVVPIDAAVRALRRAVNQEASDGETAGWRAAMAEYAPDDKMVDESVFDDPRRHDRPEHWKEHRTRYVEAMMLPMAKEGICPPAT